MPLENTKPTQSLSDGDKNKQLHREVKDMVNSLTNRLADIQKHGASLHYLNREAADEDDHGVRIITLAGTNTGATMRSELDDKTDKPVRLSFGDESDALDAYVNSNFQAVNNSIMLESKYKTNDPGVHVEISDNFENPGGKKADKHGKKGKKKDKETSESDQNSDKSD